jgi:hypothetical protein
MVDELFDSGARGDAEMVLAFWADVESFFHDFAEEHGAALAAAHPEAFGNAFFSDGLIVGCL